MQNLLAETLAELAHCNNTPADVAWVGTRDGDVAGSWSDFAAVASTIDYDPNWRGIQINSDIVVKFKDGTWLERDDTQGLEYWIASFPPSLAPNHLPLERGNLATDHLAHRENG